MMEIIRLAVKTLLTFGFAATSLQIQVKKIQLLLLIDLRENYQFPVQSKLIKME